MKSSLLQLPDPFTGLYPHESRPRKRSVTWTQAVVACLGEDCRTVDQIVHLLDKGFAWLLIRMNYGAVKKSGSFRILRTPAARRNLRAKVRQVLNDLWHHDHFGVKGKRYLNVQVGQSMLYPASHPKGVLGWYIDPVAVG